MFGGLNEVYRDPSEYLDPYFYIWTKDYEVIRYRIISAFVVEYDSDMYSIPLTDAAYQEYLAASLELGKLDSYVPFTEEEEAAMEEGNPIVSLSTCYGSAGTSKRLLVQGWRLREDLQSNIRVGTQKSNISRFESGNYNPSLDFLTKIAESLGKDISIKLV